MLSPEERHLLIGIMLVLLLGAMVKSYRTHVREINIPKEELTTLDARPTESDGPE
ncbi:MAG: hypothetical protein ACOYMN_22960 [Roseimicrobium sp.]